MSGMIGGLLEKYTNASNTGRLPRLIAISAAVMMRQDRGYAMADVLIQPFAPHDAAARRRQIAHAIGMNKGTAVFVVASEGDDLPAVPRSPSD
jgi:hypothetical protein